MAGTRNKTGLDLLAGVTGCLLFCAAPALRAESGDDSNTAANVDDVPDNSAAQEIIVTAQRLRGSVDVPQPPIAVLNEDEIAGYGAGSIADLVEAIAPLTGSGSGRGGGRPVFLLNGQRISGFRELRNLPPEAIARVEVLPEEVALRFGFPATQRVVNFILKDNYSAITAEANAGVPWQGGYATSQIEANVLRIDGPARVTFGIEASDSSGLTEAERGVSSIDPLAVAGDVDAAAYRSLVADTSSLQLDAGWSTGLGDEGGDGTLSLTGAITRSASLRLNLNGPSRSPPMTLTDVRNAGLFRSFDLPPAGFSLRTTASKSVGFELGAAMTRRLGDWDLAGTASWVHAKASTTSTGNAGSAGLPVAAPLGAVSMELDAAQLQAAGSGTPLPANRAFSNTEAAAALVTLTGRPADLPAGEVTMVVKAGYDWNDIASRTIVSPAMSRVLGREADAADTAADTGADTGAALVRGDTSFGVTLGVPLTSRRRAFLEPVGDISLDLSAAVQHLSDFGLLTTASAGVNWGVTPRLAFSSSFTHREAAPTLAQLGAPRLVTAGATVYDYAAQATVLVDVVTGGNPDLAQERQDDWKFAVNYDLPVFDRSRVIVELFDETSRNVSTGFPVLTAAVEAAFGDRVIRDDEGQLLAVDRRPVTFAKQQGRRLRYGVSLSDPISHPSSRQPDARQPSARQPGARQPGGAGEGHRGGRTGTPSGERGGRWTFGLYHTIRFVQDVLVATDGPLLNLLDGDAIADDPVARHAFDLEGGLFHKGFGLRLSANYLGRSSIEGQSGAVADGGGLTFDPILLLDARLFVDLGQQRRLTDRWSLLRNSRVAIRIDNVFAAQQRVTDADGQVPLVYRPDFANPAGRFIEVELRKQF
ncbi:TonB-dependent receptor [Croceicoccus sp. F390]|uniref:TonB-dependent receptor n=1 Tax=Croceicoccus esteveae TaxID=3075597 RepID=A0ABU2ZG27_9SPHN|nr:TonB-dependent receptor [Croceicoccus sp. F390]MDT0575311.1 TonB-dependent receptor [Croceicoccus sp. F390]